METAYTDSKGKFKPGNPGGPGNPNIRRFAEYQKSIRQAIKTKDLKDILRKLVQLAKGGDVQAAKVVLDRCLGKVADQLVVTNDSASQTIQVKFEAPDENKA